MELNLMWEAWAGAGLEQLRLRQTPDGQVIDSLVLGLRAERPLRVWYELHCDQSWTLRRCDLRLLGDRADALSLRVDEQGQWTNASDVHLTALDGCLDVDISITPFTNTLPIRRLKLLPGQAAEILVAYIAVPEMQIRALKQRYTCLETSADGGFYRYENLASGYAVDLRVDAQGLVLNYPGNWKRVWEDF